MIINDLTLLITKLEVWKSYLNNVPTPETNDLQNQLNTILLQPVTPESLKALEDFINARENQVTAPAT